MKVAIVHYWLVNMRGGEKVIEQLCEMYPDADIYTHVFKPEAISPVIRKHRIRTTFIQALPYSERWYKYYLPLMPLALRLLRLDGYDLVISSESGPAKGARKPPDALHVCYCHTPMRYIWDLYDEYRHNANRVVQLLMRMLVPRLRNWDRHTAKGVDYFVANSHFVSERIRRIYNRDAVVIAPPVRIEEFYVADDIDDYYLYVGELTYYKQPQLAVEAFKQSGRQLLLVGSGELLESLQAGSGANIRFAGKVSAADLKRYYARCRALIFPGVEDFGIVPVEAMASGRPVIAYAVGGALETVIEGESGLFFHALEPHALNAAIEQYEATAGLFSPDDIRAHAMKFSAGRFQREWERVMARIGRVGSPA